MTGVSEGLVRELPIRKCAYCGGEFRQARNDQRFCSHSHNRKYYRRREQRAARAYELLMEWRRTRGKSKEASMTLIAREVDSWIREDKESLAS